MEYACSDKDDDNYIIFRDSYANQEIYNKICKIFFYF